MGCVMVPEQDAKTFHDSPEGCKKDHTSKKWENLLNTN